MSPDDAVQTAAGGPARRRVGGRRSEAERIVAVVGAGFSGTMAAIHLRRALPADFVIHLFDRTGRFARGPAYARSDAPHLLNVRSANMSALPDDPAHFERWLSAQTRASPLEVEFTEAGTFATRRLYGRYLRALLYEEMTLSGGRVRLCADEITRLIPIQHGWRLRCASGREVSADAVVLAAGNTPSARPSDELVCHDPWIAAATERLRPNEPVLIVGTGLSMVDLALGMQGRGFAGLIIALSRRGLVPQSHTKPGAVWPAGTSFAADQLSLLTLLREVRSQVRKAARQGVDWRTVIDGLRPVTSQIWQRLPPSERSRFLRHLRPFWDSHRHRMAPSVATAYDRLVERGGLVVRRGRIRNIEALDLPQGRAARVEIQGRGIASTETLVVQRVIYATGVGAAAGEAGLIAGLVASGLARPDHHGIGLDVTGTLEVVGGEGTCVPQLWALGPLVRGVFWECTAVPDIRIQARDISVQIAAKLCAIEPT